MTTSAAAGVIDCCRTLARFSEEPAVTTRTFLSAPMRQVHEALAARMTRAGMAVRVDAAGNLRGVLRATAGPNGKAGLNSKTRPTSPTRPTLFIGSHLDTVPRAGAFDGILGVVMGVALVEALDRPLPFNIEVIGFSEEEGVRFGVPFIGSRALAGTIDDALLSRRDATGVSVADAIRAFGLDPGDLPQAAAAPPFVGYLEFHIEQGPVLERLGLPLAVVDAVAGQSRVEAVFSGTAGHAGTAPMTDRRDALAAAAEWVGLVERHAQSVEGLTATVGRIDAEPGAANVIAGRCAATLDVRHRDDRTRGEAVAALAAAARGVAARRRLDVAWTERHAQPAVTMHPELVAAIERAIAMTGTPVHHMTSGAGHDAMIVATAMPAAMLFLRTPGGLSHHPEESVLEGDVALALAAGGHLIDQLAARHA